MHQSVLTEEVIKKLAPQPGEVIVDGTLGLGGHSELFLAKIQPNGRLIGLDLDNSALAQAQARLQRFLSDHNKEICSLDLFSDNFVNIGQILGRLGIKSADVIFLDLGVSSYQLDTPGRGFSFLTEAPLDMRMSQNNPLNAAKVVNEYSEDQLAEIFKSYGEERFARRIAQKISSFRQKEPIKTTSQLSEIVKRAVPGQWQRIHPATRVFQALRIEVNKELENLERFLSEAPNWLKPGGRIGIISFHSLEDRLVKWSFREYQKQGVLEIITKKPIGASSIERKANPRSRSAKLRVARVIHFAPKGAPTGKRDRPVGGHLCPNRLQ